MVLLVRLTVRESQGCRRGLDAVDVVLGSRNAYQVIHASHGSAQVGLEVSDVTFEGRRAELLARVQELLMPRRRTYTEASQLVEHDYNAREGERLMQELVARLRRSTTVKIDAKALASLTGS